MLASDRNDWLIGKLTSILPHGSGINDTWFFENTTHGIVVSNRFYIYDENEIGTVGFSAKLTFSRKDNAYVLHDVVLDQGDVNSIIEDFIQYDTELDNNCVLWGAEDAKRLATDLTNDIHEALQSAGVLNAGYSDCGK